MENSAEPRRPAGRPRSVAKGELAAALAARQDAQARRVARQIGELLVNHLDMDEADRAWEGERARVRDTLNALPESYAERLAEAVRQHGTAGAECAIKDMVCDALTALARTDHQTDPRQPSRRLAARLRPSSSLTLARARCARLKTRLIELQEQVAAGRAAMRRRGSVRG